MPVTVFEVRDTRIEVDGDGGIRAVSHAGRPAESYLRLDRPEVDGLVLSPGSVAPDADEVECVLTDGAGLGIALRHTFVAGWQLRCVLTNTGVEQRALRLRLPLRVAPSAAGWALAEGSEAELFVLPDHGRGPVLAGRLRQGSVERITADGLLTPVIVLEPGARYVLAWEWDWLTEPAAYPRQRPTIHPVSTVRTREESIRLLAGPDVAVVAPDAVGIETEEDGYELMTAEPGTYAVELRSARGLRTLDLTWTPTAEEVLADAAAELLAGPRGSVGLPVLTGPAAAVVLQHAVAADLVDDTDEARDTLDLYEARADLSAVRPTLAALYLIGEHARTGDPGPLAAAAEQLLTARSVHPGLGLVATRVCVARLLAGQSPQPVMTHLVELRDRLVPTLWAAHDPTDQRGPRDGDVAAAAELLTVTRTTGAPPVSAAAGDPLSRLVLAAGTALGGGLPGGPVVAPELDRLGHLLATLAWIPDELSTATRHAWGLPARELAEQRLPTLLARLDPGSRGETDDRDDRRAVESGLVWLCLHLGAR